MKLAQCYFVVLVTIFCCLSTYNCAPIGGCSDVQTNYQRLGITVTDCQDNPAGNSTFWRLDILQSFKYSQASCRSGGNNTDIAVVRTFDDQRILNNLFMSKMTLDTWMWIGISRNLTTDELTWVDDSPVSKNRWYPYPDSTKNGDCAVMLILTDPSGDKDQAGTFYYTENCDNQYIVACQATNVIYTE